MYLSWPRLTTTITNALRHMHTRNVFKQRFNVFGAQAAVGVGVGVAALGFGFGARARDWPVQFVRFQTL